LKNARQYEESVAVFRKLLVLSPDAQAGHAALAEALLLAGDYQEALAEFDAEPLDGFTLYGRAMTFHELGDQERSEAAMKALLDLDDVHGWAAQIAMAHAVREERDDAMAWLEKAFELNDQGIIAAQTNPFFDNLRGDPRFKQFLERLASGAD
jgi:tetratricopeptide (TPR) repeat protein